MTENNNNRVSKESVLKVTDLSFSYDAKKPALENLDFSLAPGQLTALLGVNGAGKSTFFALLTRLFSPHSGSIFVFGHDLSHAPAKVMSKVGVVFQQSTLDLDLSVEQNLLYHGALYGFSARQTRERLGEELRQFELQHRLKDKVRNLNGGHRRRLEIVRALLHKPDLLLLDEPTVGLDIESRQYINERVRELCAQRNMAVLWATHLIEEVQAQDRVIVLHQGRIRADATSNALCRNVSVEDIKGVKGIEGKEPAQLSDVFQQLIHQDRQQVAQQVHLQVEDSEASGAAQ